MTAHAPADHPRPLHLRVSSIALVAVGGAIGTAAREGLTLALPVVASIPLAILVANLIGAFLLGLLLEALIRADATAPTATRLRLFAGTGALGGFTTYSALATDTALLLASGTTMGTGALYACATVVFGGLATWAGIVVGARRTAAGGAR
ncbi:CrcB protein [Homoserinimonas aerilata]|uniref:Fluoride-specific ion channel FluC n=1 Tax=Homoserinimonas aerilata TaxID=1162970 RepID=A0A542YKE1_9MICO|nr:CrcB family protein [Homoserinimonas aerilata]TQL48573.1 CrcB protein [Homoserinimonas aerilata]